MSSLVSGLTITDTNSSQPQGIAIDAADQTNGVWQYSLNSGGAWTSFPTGSQAVSDSQALTLAANAGTMVRFLPNANYNGSANLTFRAWDQSQGSQWRDVRHCR